MDIIKPSERKLLVDTIDICLKNRIKFVLYPKTSYRGFGGYVCEETRTFWSCFDPDEAYERNWGIFVHESCHVDQMIEETKLWNSPILLSYDKDMLEEHIKGRSRKSSKLEKYFKKTLQLELDCEKRAVDKIIKYNLNIDVDNYIRTGNVYLYSYYCFYHLKCWYNKNTIVYHQKDLIKKMPNEYLKVDQYWKKHVDIYEFLRNNNSRT